MKTIIAGCREITNSRIVFNAIQEAGWLITEVVSGCARGVDASGELWARTFGIPVKHFPANWSLGPKAGPIRNRQMAEYADALIAVWDGKSKGTKNMIAEAHARGLKVFIKVAN